MKTEVLADRYELGSLLGRGGMANVYDAYDQLLDRRVAVKLLRDDLPEAGGRQSVLSEARAAASLSHPHAVAVYDLGREAHRPFIVMELVEGCSLADLLARRGRLSAPQAVVVAGQTLSALEAAHARGLIHRDVKPANILLPGCRLPEDMDADAGVKLADFGIAKGIRQAAGELTMAGKVIGTPTYLSPEQISGRGATPRSDLYSLGIVLYEMLAGEPPFAPEGPVAMAMAHQHTDPTPLDRVRPDLPPGLVAIVDRALRKDPEERYADAADMRRALRSWRGAPQDVAPTMVDTRAGALGAAGAAVGVDEHAADDDDEYADAPAMTASGPSTRSSGSGAGTPSRMAGWRPVLIVGSLALVAVLLVMAVGALTGSGDGGEAAAPEETTQAAQDDTADGGEAPADTPEDTGQDTGQDTGGDTGGDGGGLSLPSLPDVSLPNPAEIGVEGLRDTVGRLPSAVVGERQDDLQQGLDQVAGAPEPERASEAVDLLESVRQWTADGELNDQVAGVVEAVLGRVAAG